MLAPALASSLLAACGSGSDAAPPRPSTTALILSPVADVARPTAMAVRGGDDAIYVAEKTGRVMRFPSAQAGSASAAAEPVIDLSEQVSRGGEQGLLGLTFSPDGTKLYVGFTDTGGDSRVVEYAFADGRADPASRRELLKVEQPFSNHNGGEVTFRPDGKLYIGFGDGGSQRDPADRAQDLGDLLGKILRIEPQPSGGPPASRREPTSGWSLMDGGKATDQRELDLAGDNLQISSFGEDAAGELYLLDLNGALYRFEGG